MKDFVIMTDSCCDLPKKYIEQNNIPYVSLTYNIKDKEYVDNLGESMNYKEFYSYMEKGEVPKTSQPSPETFYKTFKKILSEDKNIIYVCVSSGLSGTYNSANIAKNMVEDEFKDVKIAIIDVLTASLGQGLMVMTAVEMKKNGKSFGEIIDYIENIKFNLNTYITVDDLNHLKRGGRISNTAAFLGIMLHIKPILTLNSEGKVLPVIKVKGRKNVLSKLSQFVEDRIEFPEEQTILICHGDNENEAQKLKDLILQKVKIKNVLINYIGPVVGTYGGPGALAIFFIGKPRQNTPIDHN